MMGGAMAPPITPITRTEEIRLTRFWPRKVNSNTVGYIIELNAPKHVMEMTATYGKIL